MSQESSPLTKELTLYKQHQSELVKKYENRIIALKDGVVLGNYDSKVDALTDMKARKIEQGTFIIIKCEKGDSEYTRRFRSSVIVPHAECRTI